MGWQEALKGISPRRFMNEAAENDWDYKTFVVKASQKGIMNSPDVVAYAKILKEQQDMQLNVAERNRLEGKEVAERERLKGEAVGRREAVSQVMGGGPQQPVAPAGPVRRISGVGEEEQIPTTYQGTEAGDPWGDAPVQQAPVQPQQVAPEEPLTRRRAFEQTSPEDIQTASQFKEAGGEFLLTEADVYKRKIEEGKAKRAEERRGKDDALGWANLKLRRQGFDLRQLDMLNKPIERSEEKLLLQQSVIDGLDTKIASFQDEQMAMEKELPQLEAAASDPMLLPEGKKEAEKNLQDYKKQIEAKKREFESKQKEHVAATQKRIDMNRAIDEEKIKLIEMLQKYGLSKTTAVGKALGTEKVPAGATPASRKKPVRARGY